MTGAWSARVFSVEGFDSGLRALCRAVPLLDQVLMELEARHDARWLEDRTLRNRHRDLALHGTFALTLPDSGAVLRSGHATMLPDKAEVFGIVGRRDLLLVGGRIGFGQPLCGVLLPEQRVAIAVRGGRWAVSTEDGARAMHSFATAGIDWSAVPPDLEPTAVVGDRNYAHHAWNQLGALATLLKRRPDLPVHVTHQPLGDLADLFADVPGLRVTPQPSAALPRLDPRRCLPFAPGGTIVLADIRDRVQRHADATASAPVRDFLARCAAAGRRPVWLTVRSREKTSVNLAEALAALAAAAIEAHGSAAVLDGFAFPEDFSRNDDYDNATASRMAARDRAFATGVQGMIAERLGAAALNHVHVAAGGRLLDSIHLLGQCRAYFAHHGTLQHRAGYFTQVPGLVHASPGILDFDRAATLRDVIEACGPVAYIDPALVTDVVPPGGTAGHPDNLYRFGDIPALVAAFGSRLAAWEAADRPDRRSGQTTL